MKFFLAIILSSFLFSCQSKDDAAEPNPYAAKFVRELNPTDSFLFDVHMYGRRYSDSTRRAELEKFQEDLGLYSIEKGCDSIEIRVTIGGFAEINKLVILKNTEDKWGAELIWYEYDFNESNQVYTSRIRERVRTTPKSGWVRFIRKLFDLKILSIQDPHKIPGFELARVTDGWGIQVIIATENSYRKYAYGNPDVYPEFWQANNVVAIRDLLHDEFIILNDWDKTAREAYEKDKKEMEKDRMRNNGDKIIQPEMILEDIPDSTTR